MGLFDTLTSSANNNNGKDGKSSISTPSPASLPTVIQMYSGSQQPILLDTSNPTSCTPSTTLTYQALQVGALPADNNGIRSSTATIHVSPDVGVWNCRVSASASSSSTIPSSTDGSGEHTAATTSTTTVTNENNLVDALLAQLAPSSSSSTSTFCWTVDLTDASSVEPTISSLQSTLVRHLIQHPPLTNNDHALLNDNDGDDAATTLQKSKTTSLYDLQAVLFGLAKDDPSSSTPRTIEEACKDTKISLLICAVLADPSVPVPDGGDVYRAKQAEALVTYHLRKFAHAINAALCFVPPYTSIVAESSGAPADDSALSPSKQQQTTTIGESVSNSTTTEQPTVSYDKLIQLWRDLALGVPIWQEVDGTTTTTSPLAVAEATGSSDDPDPSTGGTAAAAAASALYGPGKQQEDLIETVLLRNANYPGHWEANKDSLWVALPSTLVHSNTDTGSRAVGDAGWLGELRESIASAMPATATDTTTNVDAGATQTGSDKKDDANGGDSKDVTDFFQSLISSKK